MPKAKFIESTVYKRLYVYVCKMGMYIACLLYTSDAADE